MDNMHAAQQHIVRRGAKGETEKERTKKLNKEGNKNTAQQYNIYEDDMKREMKEEKRVC
jgi:hypothetical protein